MGLSVGIFGEAILMSTDNFSLCIWKNKKKKFYYHEIQLLKAYRIKFQKFAAHAHKDALINETFIPT